MKILNTISKNKHLSGADPFMAIGTSVLVTAFVLFTILLPEYSDTLFNNAKQFIAKNFAWYYILLISILLFLAVFIAFSRYGSLKLGKDNEKPEFSFFAWFSMLFGAGIGIGILFWSIAEPIYHFQSNPFISPEQNLSIEAAQVAMRISIFHWGLHGWAMFAISGLALAYFSYRRGLPLSVRSTLYPILGDKIYGYIGHSVDMLAIFSTLFGIATSLGLGAQQMNAGFSYLFGLNISITNQVIIIGTISILATLSVLSGVHKGIKFLSELNMSLTIIILLFFLLLGPTVYLLGAFVTNLGDYLENFIVLGLWVDPDRQSDWQGTWTIFYWGWWIAWAPFVGIFIARISKGRSIKEFILGVILAPTLLATFWISIFGNNAMFIELFGNGGVTDAVNNDITTALFTTIELMDLGTILTIMGAFICTLMLLTYFITSADSATLVICTLVSSGSENPHAKYRVFWGLSIGAVASVLLVAGGLNALQTASTIAAFPYSVVLILMVYCLFKSLRQNEISKLKTTD